MDYWEHLTLRLYEKDAYKARVFSRVERLKQGVEDGTVPTRCQWAKCSNVLAPHLRQRYCCRAHERKAASRRWVDTGQAQATPFRKQRKAALVARFEARRATEFPTHCTSAPCRNLLHHVHNGGPMRMYCSPRCKAREESRKLRARRKAAAPPRAPKLPPAPRPIFSRSVPWGLPTHCSSSPCRNLLPHHLGKPGERRLYCSAMCANREQERRARTGRLSAR